MWLKRLDKGSGAFDIKKNVNIIYGRYWGFYEVWQVGVDQKQLTFQVDYGLYEIALVFTNVCDMQDSYEKERGPNHIVGT